MIALNLGCGTRTSLGFVNIDWSPYLRMKRNRVARRLAPVVLSGARLNAFRALRGDILVHDLRKGLPFDDESVDAVYHSHVLEHIDRGAVPAFLEEIHRVLRPGGIHRIVVPDLEHLTRLYLDDLERCVDGRRPSAQHDATVVPILEQSVRRHAYGSERQAPMRRVIERILLGDARRRGETHQWMWDRVNLHQVLKDAGFSAITTVDHKTSAIPGFVDDNLDIDDTGEPYKPASLYVEATK